VNTATADRLLERLETNRHLALLRCCSTIEQRTTNEIADAAAKLTGLSGQASYRSVGLRLSHLARRELVEGLKRDGSPIMWLLTGRGLAVLQRAHETGRV